MLRASLNLPRRVLMTLDSVGGVWRYAVDLSVELNRSGIGCVLAGFGPRDDVAVKLLPYISDDLKIVWTDQPLDWMSESEQAMNAVPATLTALAHEWKCDLLHLNLPSQAAGIARELPAVAVSHSCLPTWWEAMRGTDLPAEWHWQHHYNRLGLERADSIMVPSKSHGLALTRVYGPLPRMHVVYNATALSPAAPGKQPFVLAAGRWWDEAKDGATLDQAAQSASWPVLMAGPTIGPNEQFLPIYHARAVGALPACEFWELAKSAAIFVAPSRYEPFGLAVLEAATQQAALVLADIPTFRELWEGAALFVAPGDAAGFSRAITSLTEDAPLRLNLARLAQRRAQTYRPARQVAGVLDAYAAAIEQSKRAVGAVPQT